MSREYSDHCTGACGGEPDCLGCDTVGVLEVLGPLCVAVMAAAVPVAALLWWLLR